MALNKIVIFGTLVREPDIRLTQNGISVANFTVCCPRDFKDYRGKREIDYFDVTAWRNTAEFVARYFGKGSAIAVIGRMHSRLWTDKEGAHRKQWYIECDEVSFAADDRRPGSAPMAAKPSFTEEEQG